MRMWQARCGEESKEADTEEQKYFVLKIALKFFDLVCSNQSLLYSSAIIRATYSTYNIPDRSCLSIFKMFHSQMAYFNFGAIKSGKWCLMSAAARFITQYLRDFEPQNHRIILAFKLKIKVFLNYIVNYCLAVTNIEGETSNKIVKYIIGEVTLASRKNVAA